MEQHGHPVDDREAGQGILQLVPQLRSFEHELRRDRVVVVLPLGLDDVDVELVVVRPRAVDDAVDETPAEPARQGSAIAELVAPPPRAHDGLLGAVLRLVGVPDQAGRKVDEPRELRDERRGELVSLGRQSWPPGCRCCGAGPTRMGQCQWFADRVPTRKIA